MRAREAMTTALAIAILSCGARAIAAPPSADPSKAQAQARLREGNALLEQGSPIEALQKFEDAYRLFPSPKLHYNLGQAHSLIPGHEKQAYDEMSRFLTEATDASPELRAAAQALCQRLQTKVAAAPPIAPAPPTNNTVVEPVVPIATPVPSYWTRRHKIGVGLAALGAASLLFGVIEHVRYFGKADDFRKAGCGTDDLSVGSNCRGLDDAFNAAHVGWIVGYLGAAALGGAGGYLLWIAPADAEAGTSLSMAPGAMLHVQVRF